MKKGIIYISVILLLAIVTSGATYAYLTAVTNSGTNTVSTSGAKIEVVYSGGTAIEGPISMSLDKSGGLNTTVNIRITENSVAAKANLFINVNQITSSLATDALIWEVYKTVDGVESFVGSGTFLDCKATDGVKQCASGDKLYIVNDYLLSTTDTAFTVYIWLNGDKAGNEVLGATFKGTIGAESEEFTGILE